MHTNVLIRSTLIMLVCLTTTTVLADRDDHDRDRQRRSQHTETFKYNEREYRHDTRYEHNRYYPRRGYTITTLPERYHTVRFRDRDYYYHGGVWYHHISGQYVVIAPPIGIVIPFLPSFYTTIWVSGVPYYYADDVYYVWRPDLSGYMVTSLPTESDVTVPTEASEPFFIYPKQGQSEQKQATDKYECHSWGVKQSGYDPTNPSDKYVASELAKKRDDYHRAMKACLEGRGYSVR